MEGAVCLTPAGSPCLAASGTASPISVPSHGSSTDNLCLNRLFRRKLQNGGFSFVILSTYIKENSPVNFFFLYHLRLFVLFLKYSLYEKGRVHNVLFVAVSC